MSSLGVDGVGERSLEGELTRAINRVSGENDSNTPDYILGKYARLVLEAAGELVRERDRWYGVELAPGGESRTLPPAAAYLVVAEDSKKGVRVWPYTTWEGARDAAWFWARHRVTDPDNDIEVVEVEDKPNYFLLLNYTAGSEDTSVVWVVERTFDQPMEV